MSRVRLFALLVAFVILVVPTAAGAAASRLVISQVFGGGGNAGSLYANDYVELFNRGSSSVDLTGWSLQYTTASGTSWQSTPLSGSIPSGGHYLVQLAGGTVGVALPAPDASDTTNLSATSGKLALVRAATALTCGATPGSCSASALVEDLVGYGAATDYEGAAAAPALSSTTAALRNGDGCADTDSNAADFSADVPTPRNSTAAARACSAPAPTAPTASQDAVVDVEVQPVIALSLERATLSFGRTAAGSSPSALSERVTVLSNHAAGYTLAVHRTAFTPTDLPLALQAASAPSGGTLSAALAGAGFVAVPVAPSSLGIGSTTSTSATVGDQWQTNVGFASPFPPVAPGRYTATLTFTVIGR